MGNGGKIKKGNGNNRGYIGYHTTWDGKIVFLRSKAEFIYARKLDNEKIPYLLEVNNYEINGVKYKPDFFIFDYEYKKILGIVEVKGLDDKKTALSYLEAFKDYFSSLGIEYNVVWKQMATIKKYSLDDEIKEWIKSSIEKYDNISDVSGENNPMFNLKHSDETKKLISSKAKERCSDDKYLKMMSDVQRKYWDSEEGIKGKKVLSLNKIRYYEKVNPIISINCKMCGIIFNKKTNSKNEFCCGKCKRDYNYKNSDSYGKHKLKTSYQNQLKTYIDKIIKFYDLTFEEYIERLDEITQKAKLDKLIPKNKGITITTLKKYKII